MRQAERRKLTKLLTKIEALEEEHWDEMEDHLTQSANAISGVISRVFLTYVNDTYLSYKDLKKPLTAAERRAYPKRIRNRLQALEYDLRRTIIADAIYEADEEDELIYQVAKLVVQDWGGRIPAKDIRKAVENDGRDRTKTNKEKQSDGIIKAVLQAITRGEAPEKILEDIPAKYKKRAMAEAKRLGYTNDSAAISDVLRTVSGAKAYEFVTARDGKVCDICKPLDGEVFPYADAMTGVNFPPMHPWCRCIAWPIMEDYT